MKPIPMVNTIYVRRYNHQNFAILKHYSMFAFILPASRGDMFHNRKVLMIIASNTYCVHYRDVSRAFVEPSCRTTVVIAYLHLSLAFARHLVAILKVALNLSVGLPIAQKELATLREHLRATRHGLQYICRNRANQVTTHIGAREKAPRVVYTKARNSNEQRVRRTQLSVKLTRSRRALHKSIVEIDAHMQK